MTETVPTRPERPVGIITPTNDRARRAFRALDDDRLDDVQTNIEAMENAAPLDTAWQALLRGLLAGRRRDAARASQCLREACDVATQAAELDTADRVTALRLAARAKREEARILRRQDRPHDAYRLDLSSHELSEQHGSLEEMWASAVELGLDARLSRRTEDACQWLRTAVDLASQAQHESKRRQAIAWSRLSATWLETQETQAAVDAAVTARTCWREHDLGDAECARADMHLGHALCLHAQLITDANPADATTALAQAATALSSAQSSLAAFGPDFDTDVRWCADQLDFVQRLKAMLEPPT